MTPGLLRWSALAVAVAATVSQVSAAIVFPIRYDVTADADSGGGSLRTAILMANTDGLDSDILFDGPYHIQLLSPLPTISAKVTIDGSTQREASGEPAVHIDGSMAGANAVGLNVTAANSVIRGLEIENWGGGCVIISGPGSCHVEGCVIATGAPGAAAGASGVTIMDSPSNVIGGSASDEGNVIHDCRGPEGGSGSNGVLITGAMSQLNRVQGNRIGTDASGMQAVPNTNGVTLGGLSGVSLVGGASSGEGNLISGNSALGVRIFTDNNLVQGNIIGLAADGFTPLGNPTGVEVFGGTGNQIGGQCPFIAGSGTGVLGEGNVISGNSNNGIVLNLDNTMVFGNILGLAVDGQTPVGNYRGCLVFGAHNQIGGPGGNANVISANTSNGVILSMASATDNRVWSNIIGMDVTRQHLRGNHRGVSDFEGSFNFIGDTTADHGNLIAGNQLWGVGVSGSANNVLISRNSIFLNTLIGIDLGEDGVTANDVSQDIDSGPNLLQNYPVSLEAHFEEMPPRVTGVLDSTPSALFTIDLYVSEIPGPNGVGEGQHYLDSFQVLTTASGSVSWERTLTPPLPPGRYVTATAIGSAMNTSEFSPYAIATGRGPSTDEIVDALLGLIPVLDEYRLNGDSVVDVADVVTSVNASP